MLLPARSALLAELGGARWGLLPALASLPWLIQAGGGRVDVQGYFMLMACLMASFDVAVRRIPNPLTGLTAVIGLAAAWAAGGWGGLEQAFLGGMSAFGLMLVFYLLGAMGGGDVKALGALGCFTGPWGALQLFVFTVLAGGLLAVVFLLLRKRYAALPYGAAIAAGALAMAASGGLQ